MFCLIVTQYQGRVFGGISPLYVFMLIVVLSGILMLYLENLK
ncbi:hypothetical protein WIW90_09935 [Sulfolobaceae archaeon RB850M]